MPRERLLDVRDLAPPEPLERVLAMLPALGAEQYLRVLLHREPFPLYALLEQSGFAWRARAVHDMTFEIFIWRRTDADARAAVQDLFAENRSA